MVKFLLYLFESGLCLSILLLVYIFFFRKETYFRFNRIYLLSIMVLSLLVPFMHINITVNNTQRYERTINEIGKFRSYYEQLISMTDPDYLNPYNPYGELHFEEYNSFSQSRQPNTKSQNQAETISEIPTDNFNKNRLNLSTAYIILIIYTLGATFFLARILVLFHWIYRTISQNQIEKHGRIKVIKVNNNLPPFSFMGYVFVNQKIIDTNSEEILAHERVHIEQFHSLDLLLAHLLSIFQWFNPFAWLLQKSIKTNHEYLADSKVVKTGYNLFDYQELLLNQFISIPSVQLVNNFNLISIKNRIHMMNKTKSGFLAKFKALLIIPAALFAFILFANLTLKSPGKVLSNLSFFETQSNLNELKGMWVNTSKSTYGKTILIENSKFSVLDQFIMLKEYPYQLKSNQIELSLPDKEIINLRYEVNNDQLKIWWNDAEYSLYTKSDFNNTLDLYLSDLDVNIDLPYIENYKLIQRLGLCIDVAMVDDQIFVNQKASDYDNLNDALLQAKSKINQLDHNLITVRIFADKDLSMEYMNKLHQTLREINLLKVAHVGRTRDTKISKLQLGYIAFPKRLPPLQAEIADLNKLEKKGINILQIDATVEEITPESMKPKFKATVLNSEKYIADLYYDKTTLLKKYLGFHDMARSVIYEFRNNYALEKYNINFDDLSSVQQKEIRKKYPIIISEAGAFKPAS